ncbi:MAG TPA: hypothetical protein VF312_09480 [Propionibacteriaceae bacterium]|jgi:hypothetical protein
MTPTDATNRGEGARTRSYTWLVILVFAAVILGSAFLVFFVINP